jgi:hypothetical protein
VEFVLEEERQEGTKAYKGEPAKPKKNQNVCLKAKWLITKNS